MQASGFMCPTCYKQLATTDELLAHAKACQGRATVSRLRREWAASPMILRRCPAPLAHTARPAAAAREHVRSNAEEPVHSVLPQARSRPASALCTCIASALCTFDVLDLNASAVGYWVPADATNAANYCQKGDLSGNLRVVYKYIYMMINTSKIDCPPLVLARSSCRGGPNPRFWAGEAETPPVPSRLWLFGMYVAM
jgi:hypothetical protein